LVGILGTFLLLFWANTINSDDDPTVRSLEYKQEITITNEHIMPKPTDNTCLFHTCFDVYHCGYNDDNRITVYIYQPTKYLDEDGVPITLSMSREFQEILQTVSDSIYYTSDPDRACLFLPSIDLLNQNNLRIRETGQVLASLPRWNDGVNHLLFNMLPGTLPDYNTTLDVIRDKAVLAGGGFSSLSYRLGYDVAIPVYNPVLKDVHLNPKSYLEGRMWLLMSTQFGLHQEYMEDLKLVADQHSDFLLLDRCPEKNYTIRCRGSEVYEYPHILQDATFCLVIRGSRMAQVALHDALMAGCIPVVVADMFVMPFSEVLDWKRAAVRVQERDLADVMDIIQKISLEKIYSMRKQVQFYWNSYFNSMRAITLTTLQIINDRVFPYAAKKQEEWNEPPNSMSVSNPLFLPLIPSKVAGFTAVILTYDRIELLFHLIQQVAKAPSLAKVLVVWNNQIKPPPPAPMWPKISKPLKVVQTRQNKLSNRFYPYDEIETEAILALDDDITMLTTDEIEFGYEVWREFPDRLVGFPSRLHLWDNATGKWKYESEWTSAISIVLTGAAFYHKYYSYLYTNSMPGNIKTWVDDHMNCEDLAMNFLITNITGKPPIKVAPRQKFRCPECQNFGMLSADLTHMVERSECVTKFSESYSSMPLKTVEFRVDPVLYKVKENIPTKLRWFSDIGSL